ncbi:MAG: hypothetical protein COX62_07060 [Deltaproteobacteria bacterium CG_4_10_14_0_2_um_filter_43_8]|nr:MAG: hypothetical protein COV43_04205 [Deltaproteobacteria bacterium CG11_big_fil_rev_8_21_14_0_20_42_23]PJA19253.1 MAG: hypothetical protein COX62_07060 [Deltaproteobacteria bacterium CG_4_10_14_0_2_um_filter_43_8]PJC64128.1 MAG: hypothetical protein CO021_05910 [Deltaproteobacteria bacterium CG_4_9_14_0_2_um_filter_42_21]
MLSAHFSPAFIAKALRPDLNLAVLMLCCYSNDLLHFCLAAFKKESVRGQSQYSHSFAVSILMSVLVFFTALLFLHDLQVAFLFAACTISHFLFDLIVFRSLPLFPHKGKIPGLGLFEHRKKWIAFGLEWFFLLGGWTPYAAVTVLSGQHIDVPVILLLSLSFVLFFYFKIYEPFFFSSPEKK